MQRTPLEGIPDEMLLTMKMRDLTIEYSADGLERRFALEVAQLELDGQAKREILSALDIALKAHEKQKRGDHPYSTHPLRVAIRIMSHFEIRDNRDVIIAAILHDTVEDCANELIAMLGRDEAYQLSHALHSTPIEDQNATAKAIALELLDEEFGPHVAHTLADVTNPEFTGITREERHAQYRDHVREIILGDNPDSAIIKVSDFIDNLTGLKHNDSHSHRVRMFVKYQPMVPDMITAVHSHPYLSSFVKTNLIAKLQQADQYATEQLSLAA